MHNCSVEAFAANLTIMQNPNQLICHATQIHCFYMRRTLAWNEIWSSSRVKVFKKRKVPLYLCLKDNAKKWQMYKKYLKRLIEW